MGTPNLMTAPLIRVFPTTDRRLHQEAERACAELLPEARTEGELRRNVEQRLKRHYPNVVVRGRDELASIVSVEPAVWYVLRDGRVRLPSALRDRLYGALATSRDLMDAASMATQTSNESMTTARSAIGTSQERRRHRTDGRAAPKDGTAPDS